MADAQVTIIGGGVVGLAIAVELSRDHTPLYVLERNHRYGQEASSRNSEVIHAGIYYPRDSLKARLCLEGNRLLYELCARYGIPHRRITKIITATRGDELGSLEKLYRHGIDNGAELHLLTAQQVHELEPHIASEGGIFSPNTGIISAHGLMDYFYHVAKENRAEVVPHCEVIGIEKPAGSGSDFRVTTKQGHDVSTITSEHVINAAGLESDTIAELAGIDVDASGYRLHYCKGSYFSIPGPMRTIVSRLIYPVPPKESLGVHAVVDLNGSVKFGPDLEYLAERKLDYTVDESKRHAFAESVRRILPCVKDEDLTPDMSGIRAKLQARGEPPRDFIIRNEADKGLNGLINVIGLDSPGLTASPAIARDVRELL